MPSDDNHVVVRRARERLFSVEYGKIIRERATACMRALREQGHDAVVVDDDKRGRILRGKVRDLLDALKKWSELVERFEGEFARVNDGGDGVSSALLDSVRDSLEEFETFLDEDGILDDLPRSVLDVCLDVDGDVGRDVPTTIDLVRRVCPDATMKRADRLDEITDELSRKELDLEWRARVSRDMKRASNDVGYSAENFSYGSTPYSSWVELFKECDRLCSKMEEMSDASSSQSYVVWGSSVGWLVFYGALTFERARCKGVEILPELHDTAVRLQREYIVETVSSERVTFLCGDMLTSSLDNAGVVFLTSVCWDESVHRAAVEKLANELSVGALVIDYSDKLSEFQEFGKRHIHHSQLPVSWNPNQSFYVFEKVA